MYLFVVLLYVAVEGILRSNLIIFFGLLFITIF